MQLVKEKPYMALGAYFHNYDGSIDVKAASDHFGVSHDTITQWVDDEDVPENYVGRLMHH